MAPCSARAMVRRFLSRTKRKQASVPEFREAVRVGLSESLLATPPVSYHCC
jgi:hypothetical protein